MKKTEQPPLMDQPFAYPIDVQGNSAITNLVTEMDAITEQIWQDLGGRVSHARIQQVALEVASQFSDATVTTYLPIFIRRLTRERFEKGNQT